MPSIHYFQNGDGGENKPFRLKPVFWGALIGIVIAVAFLALCAYLMLVCAVPVERTAIFSKIILFIGAFTAGVFSGRGNKAGGWLFGLSAGLLYVLALLAVGVLESKTNILSFSAVPTVLTCCITGMIGGVFGINLRKTEKRKKRRSM